MPPSDGYTLTRRANETAVECESNGQTSTFRCNGTKWVGQLPNCTMNDPVLIPDVGHGNPGSIVDYFTYSPKEIATLLDIVALTATARTSHFCNKISFYHTRTKKQMLVLYFIYNWVCML